MSETATVRIETTPDNRVEARVTLPANLEALPEHARREVIEAAAQRLLDGSIARLDRMAHPTRRQLARAG